MLVCADGGFGDLETDLLGSTGLKSGLAKKGGLIDLKMMGKLIGAEKMGFENGVGEKAGSLNSLWS